MQVPAGRARMRWRFDDRTRTLLILLVPTLVVVIGVYLVPIVDVFRLSLTHQSLFGNGEHYVGLNNYANVLQDSTFWSDTGLTLIWTAGSATFQVGLGLVAALALHQRHAVNRVLRPLILLPWVLSGVVVAYLWRFLLGGSQAPMNVLLGAVSLGPYPWLSQPGWSMVSVIVANVWKTIPFTAVMYLAGLSAIPSDLYEAATVDGANAWQRFLHITLPGLRSVTSVLILLTTIWTMTFFDIVYVMTGGGPIASTEILPLLVYRTSFENFDFGTGSAVAILLALANAAFMVVYAVTFERGQSASTKLT
jgi:ABC-type sugar transport system permease subunit